MPLSTRRARERAHTCDRLIAVALRILESEGIGALTIRRIAGEVEYTAPVVYQHFANKDALLLAVVEVGHERLHARIAAAAERATTTDGRLYDTARAYVTFACDSPHLYQLMNSASVDARARGRAVRPVAQLATDILTSWAAEADVTLADPVEAREIVWAALHGIAGLGQLDTIGLPRAADLAERAVLALTLGWRAQSEGKGEGHT